MLDMPWAISKKQILLLTCLAQRGSLQLFASHLLVTMGIRAGYSL